ncbi:MAG: Hsp20/alpha crystallin family protein [Halobacteriaceae archaeon]
MSASQFNRHRDEPVVRQYESDGSRVIVMDTGASDEAIDTDIVSDTLILIIESDGETYHREFDLPGEEATTVINNGIITIEVNS